MRTTATLSLLALTALSCTVKAQSFLIETNDTVYEQPPLGMLSIFDIYQTNTSGAVLYLGWDSVLVDLPVGWGYSSCDFGHCYSGIPATGGDMEPVEIGELGFLGLNVMPNGIPGSGKVQMNVYDLASPTNTVLLTWFVTAAPVGIEDTGALSAVILYPNPAQEQLFVRGATTNAALTLFDINGRSLSLPVRRTTEGHSVDVSALRAGCYTLVLTTEQGSLREVFIKQ